MTNEKPKLLVDEGAIKEIRSWYWEEWDKARKEGYEQGKLEERENWQSFMHQKLGFAVSESYAGQYERWLKSQLKSKEGD